MWSIEIDEEGAGGVKIVGTFQDDGGLNERSVLLLRNFPGVARGERRREGERFGEDADLGVSGLNELSGLRDVFAEDEFFFDTIIKTGLRASSVARP